MKGHLKGYTLQYKVNWKNATFEKHSILKKNYANVVFI